MSTAPQIELFQPVGPSAPVPYVAPQYPDCDVFFYENFFNPDEADRLYSALKDGIAWQQDSIKMYGKSFDLPRLTVWYGDHGKNYTYSGIPMNPKPWTPELVRIKEQIEEIADVQFSSVLLNFYRHGKDGVSWHSDDEKELGRNPVIGSVSLGETRVFHLRHRQRADAPRIKIPLTHGSFLLMRGATQHFWEHQIPKTSRDIEPRINLTFRVIR